MQEITVKEVRGPLGKGEKRFYAVVDDTGAEFTTFDASAQDIKPGSKIGIDIKVSGKYVNITEWKMIQEGVALTSGNNGKETPRSAMSPEDWAKKDRLERFSIETQTAYKGVMELATSEQFNKLRAGSDKTKGKLDKVFDEALDWASAHFKAPTTPAPAVKPAAKPKEKEAEELWPPEEHASFKDVGELFTACLKRDISRVQAIEKLGLKEGDDLSKLDLVVAWETIIA